MSFIFLIFYTDLLYLNIFVQVNCYDFFACVCFVLNKLYNFLFSLSNFYLDLTQYN